MQEKALTKTLKNLLNAFPMIIGVLMLVNLLSPLLNNYYSKVFVGNYFFDSFIGAFMGSISFGIPVISYVTGGELIDDGVSLLAVTAFILTWSSVGLVMLPLEITSFGKKFAFLRNSLNFVSAMIISILTVLIIKIL